MVAVARFVMLVRTQNQEHEEQDEARGAVVAENSPLARAATAKHAIATRGGEVRME